MKNIIKTIFVLVIMFASVFLQSCTVAKLSGRGASPLILNQPQAKVNVVQKIEASKQLLFDYTGAVDVSEVLRDVMVGTDVDAIINITITIKVTVGDYLLNVITLGLANARTFVVNGEAVKAPNGLSSIIDEKIEPVGRFKSLSEIKLFPNAIGGDYLTKALLVKNGEGYLLYSYYDNH